MFVKACGYKFGKGFWTKNCRHKNVDVSLVKNHTFIIKMGNIGEIYKTLHYYLLKLRKY